MIGRRELILKGMLRAVGAKGYEEAVVADAVSLAGFDERAFYDLFVDKEDCYLHAIDAGFAWMELAMREEAEGKAGWRERLRGALVGLLRFLDEQPDVGRALLVEVHTAGPQAVGRRSEAMGRAVAMMDLARDESEGDAPAIAGEAVVAGILAVLHRRLATTATESFMRLLPELMYLAVLPYFGPDAATEEMRGDLL